MKAFEFNRPIFEHQEECEVILGYLKDIGKLNISTSEIEEYWKHFSGIFKYELFAEVNENNLEKFAKWLSTIVI